MDEIAELKTKGAALENINKVMAEDKRGLELQMKENNYWLYNLQQKYFHNENPDEILNDPELVNQLTIERTREMANQYFKNDNVIKLVLMPEHQ
jgi:zinc protease